MKKIRRYFSLSRIEKKIFLRAFILGYYYNRELKKQPFQDVLNDVISREAIVHLASSRNVAEGRMSWLIRQGCTAVAKYTCLPQALCGYRIFVENGFQVNFHIGVCKNREDAEGIGAHAWLTLDGKVVLGWLNDLDNYQELPLFEEKMVPSDE